MNNVKVKPNFSIPNHDLKSSLRISKSTLPYFDKKTQEDG